MSLLRSSAEARVSLAGLRAAAGSPHRIATGLPHFPSGQELKNTPPPQNAAGEITCHPKEETHQVAKGIEHQQIEPVPIADHPVAHSDGQSQARCNGPHKKTDTDCDV